MTGTTGTAGRAGPAAGGGGWLELVRAGRRVRYELGREPLTLGAPGAQVVLEGRAGSLSVTGVPPRIAHDGRGAPPTLGGRALADAAWVDGDRLEWGDLALVFVADRAAPAPGRALLEELPLDPADFGQAARLVAAGVTVEHGLADPAVVQRWQAAVRGGAFDAARAADEILASGRALAPARLDDRCATLLRDFLMTSALRGARGTVRRARGAARTTAAILVSQTVAILVYTFLLLLCAVLVRYKWNVGFDRWIDLVLGRG